MTFDTEMSRRYGDQSRTARDMVEAAAEANEDLMDKYLEEGELSEGNQAGIACAHSGQ